MIDHVTISVSDLKKSRAFYEKTFTSFSYKVIFGEEGKFWEFDIGNGALFEISQYKGKNKITSSHIAFRGKNQNQIQKFYQAGIPAGGKCNGAPGLRPQYTPTYYATFVYDPDSHNIEAIFDSANINC